MSSEILRSDWYQKQQQIVFSFWENESFIQKTIAQIDKDFAKFDLTISEYLVLDERTKEDLLLEMSQLLQSLSSKSPHRFTQLVYTIDLPETIFQALLQQESHFFEDLASCILVREAYKVYLRSKY